MFLETRYFSADVVHGRKNKEKGRILEEMDRIGKLRNNQDNKYDENREEDK